MQHLSFVPYGGSSKRSHKKTNRYAELSEIVAVTLDRKWGMTRRKDDEGNNLFVNLDDYSRGIQMLKLYLPEDPAMRYQSQNWYGPRVCGYLNLSPFTYRNEVSFSPTS